MPFYVIASIVVAAIGVGFLIFLLGAIAKDMYEEMKRDKETRDNFFYAMGTLTLIGLLIVSLTVIVEYFT